VIIMNKLDGFSKTRTFLKSSVRKCFNDFINYGVTAIIPFLLSFGFFIQLFNI